MMEHLHPCTGCIQIDTRTVKYKTTNQQLINITNARYHKHYIFRLFLPNGYEEIRLFQVLDPLVKLKATCGVVGRRRALPRKILKKKKECKPYVLIYLTFRNTKCGHNFYIHGFVH